jgi:DGQHR domain-containing protein
MNWWPGKAHTPHRNAQKVRNIQRSLDWKRVVQIAAYLLQEEIVGAPEKVEQVFSEIYEPKKNEPGRQWPPKLAKVIGFQRSTYRTFSNVLIHVNGATVESLRGTPDAAQLVFDEDNEDLNFSVIDGQHRINGAYLAVRLMQIRGKDVTWEIPAEIFLDLDAPNAPPKHQAQIFIDVNTYQKKVDRSLVADLFPTARGERDALDNKERAQDIGRRLMLETGPLVGLIQIPGIKYGAQDVVTLATLNTAIEGILDTLYAVGLDNLEAQSGFLAACLEAWFQATGRLEDPKKARASGLSDQNVAYQGRVIVSVLTLVPAIIVELKENELELDSDMAQEHLKEWFQNISERAGLLKHQKFLDKNEFKARQYLGTGGVARFRDVLWAAAGSNKSVKGFSDEQMAAAAQRARDKTNHLLHRE